MLSPRQRRLVADYEAVRAEFAGHEHVRVDPIGHLPPEAYRITYKLKGLTLEGDQPVVAEEHVVDLRLPLGYPREQPLASPTTAIFHPNVAATYCIGDYWSAGQPLTDIIAKMGDMIQYRVFNVKSPLNAVAARWVAENETIFPIGDIQLGVPEIDVELKAPGSGAQPDQAEPESSEAVDETDFAITLKREVGA